MAELQLLGIGERPTGESFKVVGPPQVDAHWQAQPPKTKAELDKFLAQMEQQGTHLTFTGNAFMLYWTPYHEWPFRPAWCVRDVETIQVNYQALIRRWGLRPIFEGIIPAMHLVDCPLIFVDVETSGLRANQTKNNVPADRIIESAIHRIEPDGHEETFDTLVNPGRKITNSQFHKIDDKMVKNAPTFDKIAAKVFQMVSDGVFISHNTNNLDMSFIKAELSYADIAWMPAAQLNTCRMAQFLYPSAPNHKLQGLAEHLGLPVKTAHRADSDVATMRALWAKLLEQAQRQFPMTETLGEYLQLQG
jgi:DNA polymerase III epsilon subunit-like protein